MGEGLGVLATLAGDWVGVFVPVEDVVVVGEDPAGDPAAAGESGAAGCRGASAGSRGASTGRLAVTAEVATGMKAEIRERGVIVCWVGGEEVGVDGWTMEYGKVFSSKTT